MPRLEPIVIQFPIRPRGAGTPEPRPAATGPHHARGTGAVPAMPHLGSFAIAPHEPEDGPDTTEHEAPQPTLTEAALHVLQRDGDRLVVPVACAWTVLMTACGTAFVADDFSMLATVLGGALIGAGAFATGLAVAAFGVWCGGERATALPAGSRNASREGQQK